jgi:hypothetical protein
MISHVIMLNLALLLNFGNPKMTALTAVVGAGVFAPVPDANFYFLCVLGDLLIGLIALKLNTLASRAVSRIAVVLVVLHILGWILNGYPANSPYHLLVRISEHAELFACILFSHQFMKKARNAH